VEQVSARPTIQHSTSADGRGTPAIMGTLALCGTIVALQQTLVVPLLPDFPRLLDTTAENASWLVTATLLTGAVATPVVARLADMYGKRLMLTVTLAIMVAGSLLGALSSSLELVVCARAMQGVGMALIPVGIATMRDELPPDRVPLGVALMSATLALGAGAGLPLAGIVVHYLDWHALFWITAAGGLVMLAAVPLTLSPSPVRTRGSFDIAGALLLSGGLTALLLVLSKGGHWGWSSQPTLILAAVGLALLVGWVPLELRVDQPLVDIRVAARPAVLLVNTASLVIGFAMFANLLVTTQQLQLPRSSGFGLGLDVIRTGLCMAPSALVFGALAPVSATITRRWGPASTLVVGAAGMAVAYVCRVYVGQDLWQVVAGSMLVAVGTSLTFAAMPTLIMRSVPISQTASANGLNTLLRSIGTSSSSATIAAVISLGSVQVGRDVFPTFEALTTLFWVSAGLSAVGAVLAVPLLRMVAAQDTRPGHEPAGRPLQVEPPLL